MNDNHQIGMNATRGDQVRRYPCLEGAAGRSSLVVVSGSYHQLSSRVAALLAAASLERPGLRVCVSVGSTPSGALRDLHRLWQEGVADLSSAHFFILDEFFASPPRPSLPLSSADFFSSSSSDAFFSSSSLSSSSSSSSSSLSPPTPPFSPFSSQPLREWAPPAQPPQSLPPPPQEHPQPEHPHFAELSRAFLQHIPAHQVHRPLLLSPSSFNDSSCSPQALREATLLYHQQIASAPFDVAIVGVGPQGEIGWTLHPRDKFPFAFDQIGAYLKSKYHHSSSNHHDNDDHLNELELNDLDLNEFEEKQDHANADVNEDGSFSPIAMANLVDIRRASVYQNQQYASCITASFAALFRARKVVMLAVSRNKASVVSRLVSSPFSAFPCAASFLFHHHPCARLFIDEGAATLLSPSPLSSSPFSQSSSFNSSSSASGSPHSDVFDGKILLLRRTQRFLAGERIICFSPHPDDTSISAGATLAMLNDANKVTSCVATTGHRAFIPDTTREQRVLVREQEAAAEAALLGADCEFLRLPLYDCGQLTEQDIQIIESYIRLRSPTVIFLPHTADTHPTHRDVLRAILEALRRIYQQRSALLPSNLSSSTGSSFPVSLSSSPTPTPSLLGSPFLSGSAGLRDADPATPIATIRLFMYEGPWSLFPPSSYNTVVSPPLPLFAKKEAAILAHKSQVDRTAYDKAADALATMRGVLVPEQDLAGFGGQGPKIDAKIELFYYHPIREAADVEPLITWLDERRPPIRFPHLKL